MAVSVVMPALEMAQESGKVISWRKREGEKVAKGEPLLEVETDKAVVEVESPGDGILSAVSAREGAVIPVGQTIAWLLAPGEAAPVVTAPTQTGRRTDSAAAGTSAASAAASSSSAPASTEVRMSPKARRLAREHGVDVTRLRGSGPGGEVLAEDILKAAQGAGASSASCGRRWRRAGGSWFNSRKTAAERKDRAAGNDRAADGCADDAKLDFGAALFRDARGGCQRPGRSAQANRRGNGKVARHQSDAHRLAGRAGGSHAGQASADECELGRGRHSP